MPILQQINGVTRVRSGPLFSDQASRLDSCLKLDTLTHGSRRSGFIGARNSALWRLERIEEYHAVYNEDPTKALYLEEHCWQSLGITQRLQSTESQDATLI